MLSSTIQIGDEVTIILSDDDLAWGYCPCPSHTKATIVDFTKMYIGRSIGQKTKPGVYISNCWYVVKLPDGTKYIECNGRFELSDRRIIQQRLAEIVSKQPHDEFPIFVEELPETRFWEGDFVKAFEHPVNTDEYNLNTLQIIGIEYQNLNATLPNGKKYWAYKISDSPNFHHYMHASEDDLILIKRGKPWEDAHKK